MKINSIQAGIYPQKHINYNSKSSVPNVNRTQGDTISFSGKQYPVKQLDKYIDSLEAFRNINTAKEQALDSLKTKLNTYVEAINEKISPLLEDETFLWAITPEKAKKQYSAFAVESAYVDAQPKNQSEIWNNIHTTIRKHILTEEPKDILNELEETIPTLNPGYQENSRNLSKLIKSKVDVNKRFEEKSTAIVNHYSEKTLAQDTEIIKQQPAPANNNDRKAFFREAAHRAIERKPELKDVYTQEYKEYFNYLNGTSKFKRGQAMQEAADYANLQVLLHVQHGGLEDIPF